MQGFSYLIHGFLNLLDPKILLPMTLASISGILIGALPGLTATMSIALLSGLTYDLDPGVAIPMLIALYVGAIYGGSQSAILLNIPGTPSAAATALDGYPLAKKGQAGPAIGLTRVASFYGGLVGIIALTIATPLLAKLALKFGSWEFFVIAIMGIMVCGSLTIDEIPVKGWITGFMGLIFAMVGMDNMTMVERFTFGNLYLQSGISLIPALIGLFGFTEVITVMAEPRQAKLSIDSKKLKVSIPFKEIFQYWKTTIRSALIGIGIGIIPGVGEDIAAWVSYGAAKNTSKNQEEFGRGSKEGIIAAETANNSCIGGASIPLLALAIPGSGAAAVLLGGIWLHGIRPGPLIFKEFPGFVYEYISMQVMANIMLLIFGLLISNITIKVLLVKKDILMPIVATLCVIGSYAVNTSVFDVYMMLFFGILGFILRVNGYPLAPMTLGIILGTMADENLRRALNIGKGSILPFFTRPLCVVLWLIVLVMILSRSKYFKQLMRKLFSKKQTQNI